MSTLAVLPNEQEADSDPISLILRNAEADAEAFITIPADTTDENQLALRAMQVAQTAIYSIGWSAAMGKIALRYKLWEVFSRQLWRLYREPRINAATGEPETDARGNQMYISFDSYEEWFEFTCRPIDQGGIGVDGTERWALLHGITKLTPALLNGEAGVNPVPSIHAILRTPMKHWEILAGIANNASKRNEPTNIGTAWQYARLPYREMLANLRQHNMSRVTVESTTAQIIPVNNDTEYLIVTRVPGNQLPRIQSRLNGIVEFRRTAMDELIASMQEIDTHEQIGEWLQTVANRDTE